MGRVYAFFYTKIPPFEDGMEKLNYSFGIDWA